MMQFYMQKQRGKGLLFVSIQEKSSPFLCLIQFRRSRKINYFTTLGVIVRTIAQYIMCIPLTLVLTGVFQPQSPYNYPQRGLTLI